MRTTAKSLTKGRVRTWSVSVGTRTRKKGKEGERGRVDNGSTSIERDTNDLSSSRTTTEDEAHSGTLLGPK